MPLIECPHCHKANDVAPSHIGQYVNCQSCGSKYYVYVPPLESDTASKLRIAEPSTPRLTEQAALHSENRVMMRQEALLAEIHEDLIRLQRRVTIACFVVVAASAVLIAVILLR